MCQDRCGVPECHEALRDYVVGCHRFHLQSTNCHCSWSRQNFKQTNEISSADVDNRRQRILCVTPAEWRHYVDDDTGLLLFALYFFIFIMVIGFVNRIHIF
jgi:hypothetical protein